jgi:hypothetical protein
VVVVVVVVVWGGKGRAGAGERGEWEARELRKRVRVIFDEVGRFKEKTKIR